MRTSPLVATLAAALLSAAALGASAGPAVTEAAGIVQVQGAGYDSWKNVTQTPLPLSARDQVRTGSRSRAVVTFDDGTRIELGPESAFALEESAASRAGLRLSIGRLKAIVQKALSRRFEVRTPAAVCSVRGTEFEVRVETSGRTHVSLYKGLLGVADNRGSQVLMQPGERLRIDVDGMGALQRTPSPEQGKRESFHNQMRREVGLDMSKEEVLAAAAREIKLAEYQQGKALTDVFGNRVRVEEYILRPRSDQFKFVVLNERESRFDYFYYLGTFNKALPGDLSAALRQLPGTPDAPPEYYLTGFETGRSNTVDSMRELAAGGHAVDVNNNADATDDVGAYFDAAQDRYVELASGQGFHQALFDDYGFYINGKLKYGWTGTNIQSYADVDNAPTTDPISGALLTNANAWLDGGGLLAARSVSVTFPNAELLQQTIHESFSDGTFTRWDNYIIDNDGNVAPLSAFSGVTSGADFKKKLLDFNYEQVVTSTHFEGRKIDLVVEPKILIQSGLVQ